MASTSTDPDTPAKLYEFLSAYPIVSTLARYLRYRDCANLALVNRTTYAILHPPGSYFDTLTNACEGCTGHGIRFLRSPDLLRQRWLTISSLLLRWALFARCKVVGGRPCEKCGRETCKNCRFDPDFGVAYYQQPMWLYSAHKSQPIFHKRYRGEVVMAMCPDCDERTEKWVRRTYPDDRRVCDCKINRRWICHGCRYEEQEAGLKYSRDCVQDASWRTQRLWPNIHNGLFSVFKLTSPSPALMPPAPRTLKNWPLKGVTSSFLCQCRAFIPAAAPFRCAWCKRRHDPNVIRVFQQGWTDY